MTNSCMEIEEGVIFLDNLREVDNLSAIRKAYNSVVYCRKGRIMIEMGGNQQYKINPGQMLLIPTGKVIQPLMVSTDIEANALLISDQRLKAILGNQINIWNKAMYMKEIYVIECSNWLTGIQDYTRSVFHKEQTPVLLHEIIVSFLRTLLLMVCEELLGHDDMSLVDDSSSIHDKEIFNQFLQLLSKQEQKRKRVSFYANQLNISPKYLSSVAKKVSGKNPMRWITESTMQDCYSLLTETDMSIKEISNKLGFPNSSFFSQYFREQAKVTPLEYRFDHKRAVR